MSEAELRLGCLQAALNSRVRLRRNGVYELANQYYDYCKSGQAPSQDEVPVTSDERVTADPVQDSEVPFDGQASEITSTEKIRQKRKRRTQAEMAEARALEAKAKEVENG